MMIDSLCQCYHWSLEEAMKLTMPQIIMLQHASHINMKRMEARREANKQKEPEKKIAGKPVEEASSEDIEMMLRMVNR